jgi:membrane-bound lytic murein transglycosylase D
LKLSLSKCLNLHHPLVSCLLISLINYSYADIPSLVLDHHEEEQSNIFQFSTDSDIEKKGSSGKISKMDSGLLALAQPSQLPIWHKIRNGYQFLPNNPPRSVAAFRREYLGRREYLSIVLERSRPFIFYITEQLKLANMPLEIALLPIIESGYDPFAYSKSHAAGLWQFIPSTGEYFGLEQNDWYDGRLDVVNSTRAALKYLMYLYNHFNHDWFLALAAYNAGEGFINKRIMESLKSGLSGDYWSLKLPRQTSEYVPRLLAIADIVKNPQHYAVKLPHIPNRPFFDIILLKEQIEVSLVLQKGFLSMNNFSVLNAAILESITPPLRPYHLLVPTHRSEVIRTILQAWREETLRERSEYTVVFGDTLSEIAQKHNVDLDWLMKTNNRKFDHLSIGETLLIPNKGYLPSKEKETKENFAYYRVVAGDSLSKIGHQFNMPVNEIKRINLLQNDLINVGQILKVQSARQIYYNIKSGNTLSGIAKKYGTTVEKIIDWNNIQNSQLIHPGQTLLIYLD